MPTIRAVASAIIDAPPAVVYGLLADYHEGHPSVLPQAYFGRIFVDEGGTGAGTRFRVETRQPTGIRTLAMEVTEPEPGRVLCETEIGGPLVTHFTVDPVDGGRRAKTTIETEWTRGGVQGLLESVISPPLFRHVFRAELRQLNEVASRKASEASTPAP